MFVNHLREAEGEQDGEANKAQESFAEFVIPSSDSSVTFNFLEEVFYPMTTPVDRCGEWDSHSAVTATRNAGIYSFSGRCLPEGRAIIGFVANEGRVFRQALGGVSSSASEMSASFPADKAMTTACDLINFQHREDRWYSRWRPSTLPSQSHQVPIVSSLDKLLKAVDLKKAA